MKIKLLFYKLKLNKKILFIKKFDILLKIL